jgi:uncharacterized protein (DUF305 family)
MTLHGSARLNALSALLVCMGAVACAGSQKAVSTAPKPETVHGDIASAKPDSNRFAFTEADVQFMTGMISHHAQAIAMAWLAPERTESQSMRTLAGRITNAQGDEIAIMQNWLRDRGQPVPEPNPKGMTHTMGGEQHVMLMPGMLTDEQMKQLEGARGTQFDKLFLQLMIQHHRGAVSMVKDLFNSYGAGQDETVFKFASDVNVDQTTEIARMERMLFAITIGNSTP